MANKSNKNRVKQIIHFMARIILGGIFIYASIDKIAFPGEFAKAVQAYTMLPEFLINPIAILLPWIELIAGIFIITGILLRQAAFFISILLIVFLVNTTIGITSGTLQDCGCFPKSSFLATSNIPLLVLRDSLFLLSGIFIIFSCNNERKKYFLKGKK